MMGHVQVEMPGEGQDTLGALRVATAAAHARIENVLALETPSSLSHYARVLRGFDCFLEAWEPSVARALPPHLRPWFEPRRRSPLVARDLEALRVPHDLMTAVALPTLDTGACALGSLYVLEGSALGGQVIAQRMQRWHGIGAHDGAAYFTGWGERTGAMWREFRHVLACEVTDAASRQAACAGAIATFDALTATFEHCLNEPAAA
jgi:heme oxygenase